MRILIILREFYSPAKPIGGAERQAVKLSTCLVERGVDVKIVAGKWDWGQKSQDQIEGLAVDRHFTAWGMFDIRGLRRISPYIYLVSLYFYLFVHRNEYDLIHCHSALFGAYIVTSAGRRFRKKTLIRAMASGVWGDVQRVQQGTTIFGARWMQRQAVTADCFIALNPQVEDELISLGVSPEIIHQIPNGVVLEPENPKQDYVIRDKVTILFVGRLHPQKGVEDLIRAFEISSRTLPDISWSLKIAGSGYLRNKLEQLSEHLSVNDKVEFLGEIEDPDSLYLDADIFLLPSHSEGMSNSLLEALAHGLPVIASDIPGNHDLIVDQENGLLFEENNYEELAEELVRVVQDANLRKRIGSSAYLSVVDHYSINKITDRYIDLYKQLLDIEGQS